MSKTHKPHTDKTQILENIKWSLLVTPAFLPTPDFLSKISEAPPFCQNLANSTTLPL